MNSSKQDAFDALVVSVLKKIAIKENVKDAHVGLENALKGEGYVGIVSPVEIKGSNKNLDVIVKTANKDEKVRAKVPLRQSFLAELCFYGEVVPELQSFHPNVEKLGLLDSIAKCYWVETGDYQEILVLDNLMTTGYEIWDRMKPFDTQHTEMVLKQYARLHAVSMAFKHKHPEKYEELSNNLGDNTVNWFRQGMLDSSYELCLRARDSLESEKEKKIYGDFCETITHFMLNYDKKNDPYAVISHADCWSNNMMFKYENVGGNKQLERMKLIDFQLTRSASLTYDVSQFLCTCTDETIWKNIDYYLRLYYDTLRTTFEQVGGDPKLLLSFDTFMKEFNKNARYGFVMSAFFIRVMLIEKEEAPDEYDTVKDTFWGKFLAEIKNESAYNSRFKYLIHYFCENDLF